MTVLSIKVDVDTDRGTRIGVPNLLALFNELDIQSTFLFSLGPDNTGRAIKRIFRKGFFKKVQRTSVLKHYGLRTLLNGVLLPGPHIGRRNEEIVKFTRESGHEVGIHCYDHVRWQDHLHRMSVKQIFREFEKACHEFSRIFGVPAKTAGAAGWQANASSLRAYDAAKLQYASDTRGDLPYFPRINGEVFKTLQIPTTLPTLDELLGRPEFPEEKLIPHYLSLIKRNEPNVLTIHAEMEGMHQLPWFKTFLQTLQAQGCQFITLASLADSCYKDRSTISICDLILGQIDGRSGMLALQSTGDLTHEPHTD